MMVKPFSFGLEIGKCNWTLSSPERNITGLSSYIFMSTHVALFKGMVQSYYRIFHFLTPPMSRLLAMGWL